MKRWAPLFDVLFVLLFVAIGRSAHDHGISVGGMASTTWPFAVGLAVGWWAARRTGRALSSPLGGVVVVVITVAVGMVLRVLAGQGTALAFIIVALAFLSLFLVGWRLAVPLVHRR